MTKMSHLPRVNLDEPRWDQSTYIGRVKYFFSVANPLNIFVSSQTLDEARTIVLKYKAGEDLPSTLTLDDVYRAKLLYDSAFHPDTGEKMTLVGRMSAQVPMNMFITGMMMTFYKSTPAVVFWQWFNQSFNAVVNYTNRSGANPIPADQLAKSYAMATSGALATALTLNRMVKRAPPLIGRLVPFAAVAAANCINIPTMRIKEIETGIPVYDINNNKLGESKVAAKTGIAAVVFSRVVMGSPSMVLTPVIVNKLDQKGVFRRYPWSAAPVQTLICGAILTFATPMACAIFSQRAQINVDKLEKHIQEKAAEQIPPAVHAYYNKGL
ncbi:sideroflexin-1-3-like [Macrosteles quadrilineatus]|uniref:sideroflexin-1-3-like n=1 Tax=Macrosteles quadrilineatus TaxID=74068 RepID=UPI0023E0C857|nr:sideroflexin-1-3-like [Macrosteles quadrilineatus]